MRAAVLTSFGSDLLLQFLPTPTLGTGDIIVEIIATLIVPYLNQVLSGARKYLLQLPCVPGPAAIGRVNAVGPDATHLKVGDWVFCDPTIRSRDDALVPDITLQGLSAREEGGMKLQKYFKNGSFAEQMLLPTENCTAIGEIDECETHGGETILISGATGSFGSAAVAVAMAMGAGRVVAPGRNEHALADLQKRFGSLLRTCVLSGVEDDDRENMMQAAGALIDCVLDILPPSARPMPVRAAIMAVRPYGRVVLMGGVGMLGGPGLEIPYPWIMRNCITLKGQWMYSVDAPTHLARLVRAGLLDLGQFEIEIFGLENVNKAVEHAVATAGPFRMTVLTPRA
ncbi:alcohol dehydrogenase zinc-binding domain protein [Fimicolochytrium jonesii]|uniref:alcohol dehydrogenase zinc-binding domain protein n=1 Tax=Fimicolochytrium jonesii TaxID=1396493 RepID=UPI0022FE6DE6|nr:alcohol dehydrogenase zinc-binding domain protein [Fimicolochytrium jonesii]KAI8823191.1 alcohol dehydrogenase zinc-binding domain protein [Fimicolochytrium jonesii]